MVLALDSSVQRVWRSPHALQFGVERPRLVLDPVDAVAERMIAALADGIPPGGLRLIALRAGGTADEADALLARLGPVLAPDDIGPPGAPPAVVLDGDGPTSARIVRLLHENGVGVRSGLEEDDPAVETADAAVIVAAYAVEPRRHHRWLRRDIPHLPVVFSDAGVTVGPFVRPGEGPCLGCVDLHRRDADAAWPAMAAQLYRLPRPGETELACGAVASAAAGAVLALLGDGAQPPAAVASRFDGLSARWEDRTWAPHPACGCLSLPAEPPSSSRSRSGSATPADRTDGRTGCHAAPS